MLVYCNWFMSVVWHCLNRTSPFKHLCQGVDAAPDMNIRRNSRNIAVFVSKPPLV